ncbi:MAG: hypothetical protein AAF530_15825 [Pseudomonadota bacterium]
MTVAPNNFSVTADDVATASSERWMRLDQVAQRWAVELGLCEETLAQDLSDWYAAYCMRDPAGLTEMDQDQAMVQFLSLVGTPSIPKAAVAIYCQEHGLDYPAFWFAPEMPKMPKQGRHQDLSVKSVSDPAVRITSSCDKYFASSHGLDVIDDRDGAAVVRQIANLLATDDLPVTPEVMPKERSPQPEDGETVAPLPSSLRKRWENSSKEEQAPAGHPFRRNQNLTAVSS